MGGSLESMIIRVCDFNLKPDSWAFLQHAQLTAKCESKYILKRERNTKQEQSPCFSLVRPLQPANDVIVLLPIKELDGKFYFHLLPNHLGDEEGGSESLRIVTWCPLLKNKAKLHR